MSDYYTKGGDSRFDYGLRFNEDIPEALARQSVQWQRLRSALNKLVDGSVKSVTVILKPDVDFDLEKRRIQQAVYNWSKAVGLENKDKRTVVRGHVSLDNTGAVMENLIYVWLEPRQKNGYRS